LPDMDGLEVLRHMKDARPTTEVIVVTGYGSMQKAVEATKAGAFFFVEKPFDFEELQLLVDKALERRELVAETANMRRQLSTRAEYYNIIGSSKPMQTIYETIESVAKSDANVLIVGESGTGKELIANAIHYQSLRSKKPFIKVNCAALPKELIESELFGHTKGAFTGAHADKEGLVQHAAGGSLMLDEIAEMPIELQPKLLRVLQERSYRKIGSEKTYAVDFRLVCSTNRPPADAIRDGLLRDDLFYRISTITIHVPPLRERSEDIQLLTDHFLHMYAQKYERPITGVSQAAYQRLFSHAWPGNVRELQNVIERMLIRCRTEVIGVEDVPAKIREMKPASVAPFAERRRTIVDDLYQRMTTEQHSFWTTVYPLYMQREITRTSVRDVVRRGLQDSNGSYKIVARLFNMEQSDYKKFLNFLRKHHCQPSYKEFR
jgi:two-component system, NtrC family, response regulator AtoC